MARISRTSPSSPTPRFGSDRSLRFGPFYPAGDHRLFPWIPVLEGNWRRIQAEMAALGEDGFLRWPTRSGYTGDWKVFPLFARGARLGLPEELCPQRIDRERFSSWISCAP